MPLGPRASRPRWVGVKREGLFFGAALICAPLQRTSGKRATDRVIQKRGEPKKRKANARDIRLAKDWAEYEDSKGVKVEFPDPADTSRFTVTITPVEGYWKDASFVFEATVPLGYPHEPPAILLKTTPIYHPNINFEGKICLNVLRDGWQPVMTMTHVIYGLLVLFTEPNPHDPLPNGIDGEWEAANLLRKDPAKFQDMVRATLEGGFVRRLNKHFPELLPTKGGKMRIQDDDYYY